MRQVQGLRTSDDVARRLAAIEHVLKLIAHGDFDVPGGAPWRDSARVPLAPAAFTMAFDQAPAAMAIVDLSGRVLHANHALCTLMGATNDQLTGSRLRWLDREPLASSFLDVVTGQSARCSVELRCSGSDGEAALSIGIASVRDDEGALHQVLIQVGDDTERQRYEDHLRHMADHDVLTGACNRAMFERALAHHVAMAGRYDIAGALLVLDLDGFKYVNDSLGHHAGDRVLIDVANALRGRLRESDVLGRLGGDEFAIVLAGVDAPTARTVADELAEAVRTVVVEVRGQRRGITVSTGLVLVDGTVPPPELMVRADLAMYASKEAGRDTVSVYEPALRERVAPGSRLTLLARIEQAIAEQSFLLDAQPIVDLTSGTVVRHELLVRLPGPDGPLVAEAWLPVAQRYGLGDEVDRWVLRQAIELLRAGTYSDLSINVAASTVVSDEWHRDLSAALDAGTLDPARITFEITESATVGHVPTLIRRLEELRARRCRVTLDRFGAELGSFAHLKHVAYDDVKIDGGLVRQCVGDLGDRAVIRAMVEVASRSGSQTIAACVEDAETLDLLREEHVELAQGHHIGRPAPVRNGAAPPPTPT